MSLDEMFPDPKVRALAAAAGKGDVDKINRLVQSGTNVNSRGTMNATPLFWAIRSTTGFTRLLELGADPNVIFDDGGTVMHWVAGSENPELLKVALKHGGNPNLVAGELHKTPIFEAIGAQPGAVEALLDAGADIDARSKDGTPLMVAAGRAEFHTVYMLLLRGADYEATNEAGDTLAKRISRVRRVINPDHDESKWLSKVTAWLEQRGVTIPQSR